MTLTSPQSPVCQSVHSLILQASAEEGLKVMSHADSSFNTREYFIEKQPTYRSLSPSPHVREHCKKIKHIIKFLKWFVKYVNKQFFNQ